jgi:hypothetical protein
MALSQLITTIDIEYNNIGVGNTVKDGTLNAVALGKGQNVGIGTDNPLAGLHIGKSENTIPALYVADATGRPLPDVSTGDGIFSALAGVPTFKNNTESKSLFTFSERAMGIAALTAGTVKVTAPIVTTSSVIFLTRTTTNGDVTTIGTLSVGTITDGDSFTVKSTVETDVGSFMYFIINI